MPTTVPTKPEVWNTVESISRICGNCEHWNRLPDNKDSASGSIPRPPEGICNLISNNPLKIGDPMNAIYARAGSATPVTTTQSFYCAGFYPKGE